MSEEEKVEEGAAAEETAESVETPAAGTGDAAAESVETPAVETDAAAAESVEEPAAETKDAVAGSGEEAAEGEAEAVAESGPDPEENSGAGGDTTEVRQAQFQPLQQGETIASGNNLDLIMEVAVPVTIDLGGAIMPLREVLALGPGSVVKLDRPLGEPVDIKVNGELVGRGDVVVVDDQFGVQVTELNKPVRSTT